MASSRSVTINTYPDAMAAHMVRIQLEALGIEAWLHDEYTVSLNPIRGHVIGGVKLAVHPDDEAQARYLLFGEQETDDEMQPHCPTCRSHRIGPSHTGYATLLLLTIMTCGLYLALWYKRFECEACHHRW